MPGSISGAVAHSIAATNGANCTRADIVIQMVWWGADEGSGRGSQFQNGGAICSTVACNSTATVPDTCYKDGNAVSTCAGKPCAASESWW